MKIKVKSNMVSGIAAVVFAVALFVIIPFQIVDISNKLIKADFLPKLMAGIILICGICLIAKCLRHPESEKVIEIDLMKEARVIMYFAALVLFVVLFTRIGFLLDSLWLAVFTLIFVKDKNPIHYAITIAYVVILFIVFKYALSVPLPTIVL